MKEGSSCENLIRRHQRYQNTACGIRNSQRKPVERVLSGPGLVNIVCETKTYPEISLQKSVQLMLYFHQMTLEDKRRLNEKKFHSWEKLPNGGRRYWLDVKGKHGWKARYVKEVDAMEETVNFYQEIHDENGNLTEVHEKFPVDKGHRKV